jgi:hypothetical protein
MRSVAILTGVAFLLTACATAINSERQTVLLITYPPEAEVWVDDKLHIRSPGKITLSRLANHVAVVEKEGYEPAVVNITRSQSWWIYLNIVCTIFLYHCWKSDVRDGGYYTFDDEIIVRLNKKP